MIFIFASWWYYIARVLIYILLRTFHASQPQGRIAHGTNLRTAATRWLFTILILWQMPHLISGFTTTHERYGSPHYCVILLDIEFNGTCYQMYVYLATLVFYLMPRHIYRSFHLYMVRRNGASTLSFHQCLGLNLMPGVSRWLPRWDGLLKTLCYLMRIRQL